MSPKYTVCRRAFSRRSTRLLRAIQQLWTRSRFAYRYMLLLTLMLMVGGWLVADFWQEHDRIAADTARLAIHKSQLMSRAFGDTFVATDYVLRDVLGRVNAANELTDTLPAAAIPPLEDLLKEKLTTVSGLTDLILLNRSCLFVAAAISPLRGEKNQQPFCTAGKVAAGQSLHVQYLPPAQSASGQPVVLMSRIVGSEDGQLLGGVMAVIELNAAQKWITTLSADPQDVLALVDTEGVLLARNPPQPEAMGKRTRSPLEKPSFSQVGSGNTFTTTSPIDGQERIFGLSKLAGLPFIAIVGFEKKKVFMGWQHRAWQFSAGFVLLFAISLLAVREHLVVLRQEAKMRALATTDALTGMPNRRHVIEAGHREFARAQRQNSPLSVLMLDIDHFKSVNDTWGHATGDAVLQVLAGIVLSSIRGEDVGGRLGGEEFAVVLPDTDAAGAQVLAERLRLRLEGSEAAKTEDATVLKFTVSIGVATLSPEDSAFEALLKAADKALYTAKGNGRNCVVAARRERAGFPHPHIANVVYGLWSRQGIGNNPRPAA